MILSTTNNIETHEITEYIGMVFSEQIVGANIVKDIMAKITNIVGGKNAVYRQTFSEARHNATKQMVTNAERMGADAVVGIKFDYETINPSRGGGSIMMVTMVGTALKIRSKSPYQIRSVDNGEAPYVSELDEVRVEPGLAL